ncbi:GGDEF domain-containing protein [Actinokineospora diospyrosa]|uniref:Diguanylate cyclase (GGDEF) domain-containing protein n=1 Tax=Actinokineospora diospyrosa TaxID=103728 RepID=A0ABT1IFP1_9PSEU|nr:GGDEF domain-containing protein [Actinokineospora diospyrosa]MCP2271463.1 diguanylate cyclase (GGDEF) domain-containing protein [Actinokineospora diospyrosa]
MGGIRVGSGYRYEIGSSHRYRADLGRRSHGELGTARFAGIPFALSRPIDGGLTGGRGGAGEIPRQRKDWGATQRQTSDFDRATIMVLLAIYISGALGLAAAIWRAPEVSLGDWGLFLALAACALIYTELTETSERRRRSVRTQRGAVEYVDQASIWFFSAALLLPPLLAGLLVAFVRVRRFRVAQRPVAVWFGNTSAILLAVAAVSLVRGTLVGQAWPTDFSALATAHGWRFMGMLGLAAVVYFLVEAALVGVYRGVRFGNWSLGATLGSHEDNLLLGHTLLVGLGAVVAAMITPVALFAVLAVAVMETRTLGRLAVRTADRDRLRIDATTDPLTGLRNRRGFEPLAAAVVAADQAAGRPTAVLMLDLDHFKTWNDRLTHFGGDQVLRAVAEALCASTRSTDLLSRWGGEELAVVLPDTSSDEALIAAERIRVAVRRLDTAIELPAAGPRVRLGHDVPPCTISIGVACAPDHGTDLTDLQQLADRALGAAKLNGRDRVVLLDQPSPADDL